MIENSLTFEIPKSFLKCFLRFYVMKVFVLTFFLTAICINVYSQHGWVWQNPIPTSNTIYNIKYFENNLAFGVGDFGTIIKTTNAGNNWILIKNFTSTHFRNLAILDSEQIFVVGESGTVYRSTNAGVNWIKINFGVNTTFNDIFFF